MEYLIYSVEDDKDIAHIINVTLTKQGYKVETFFDGKSLFDALNNKKPNMILLDMMLPDIQGQEILKTLRNNKEYDDVEIIIVSANRMIMDKVDGLDLGADDYIEKPFDILELMSRINAKVRRHQKSKIITLKDITIDINKHTCFKDNKEVILTVKEFAILSLLFESKGDVVSRDKLLSHIWGDESGYESRTIDMHIKSLRRKIKDDKGEVILTVYGLGYKVNL